MTNVVIYGFLLLVVVSNTVLLLLLYNKIKGVLGKINRLHKDVLENGPSVNSNSPTAEGNTPLLSPYEHVKYLVVAGNVEEARQWKQNNSISTNEFINVTDEGLLWEYTDKVQLYPVIFTGTWSSRKDATELWDIAQRVGYRVMEE